MSDIVERLRAYSGDDHERGCSGRYYDCHCGYDGKRDQLIDEAADRIEQLEAEAKTRTLDYLGQVGQLSEELERLRAALRKIASNSQQRYNCFCGACIQARAARAALEERT